MDQAQALRDALSRVKRGEDRRCRLLAVASGKGGVGKSMLAVNLAIALCRQGQRVLVVDADFGLANIDVMLGITAKHHLGHVLSGEMPLSEIVLTGYEGVRFISGGSGVKTLLNMTAAQMQGLLSDFLQLESLADIIIFDVGAGISSQTLGVLSACDEVLVLVTPEPTSILDAYALVKTLVQAQQSAPRLRLLVNRAETPQEAVSTLSSFSQVVYKYLNVELDQLGYILMDPAVPKAVRMQVPFIISFPQSIATSQIEAISLRYLNLPAQSDSGGGVRRFFSRLAFWRSQQ